MVVLAILFVFAVLSASAQDGVASRADGPGRLLQRMEDALARSDAEGFAALFAVDVPPDQVQSFVGMTVLPAVTRTVVRERDRAETRVGHYRLIVEVFLEQQREARITTYRFDVERLTPPGADGGEEWRVAGQELLSSVEGLFQLELNAAKQFSVRNLTVAAEDMTLTFTSGTAFVSETPAGVTALVLMGSGELRFSPEPDSERGQLRIFCGQERLVAPVSAAFVRLHPDEFAKRVDAGALGAERVDAGALARAKEIFDEGVTTAFALDLGEISGDTWSLIPSYGDFLADVRTRKYGTLTYSIATAEPESIQLFDRKRRRTISTYASRVIREARGAAFNEDLLADYDVIDYDIEASFEPKREWLEGVTRVKLRSRRDVLPTIRLKLHDSLTVQSVSSPDYGRLLAIRVKGQNSFIVNLPAAMLLDQAIELRVAYAGRAPLLDPDREVALVTAGTVQEREMLHIEPEPRFILSNHSYWYPQATVTDFATARLRLSVPAPYVSVASGSPSTTTRTREATANANEPGRQIAEFVVGQPVRYLSWVVAELLQVVTRNVEVPEPDAATGRPAWQTPVAGPRYTGFDLAVVAHPRQVRRGQAVGNLVQSITQFYAQLVADVPFPSLTVALVDNDLPGGHSPGYFALLYQPLSTGRFAWRNDPVNFDNFPEFFLAHELAHQYWGQAVSWKSYHEQWISEGFAQYFAALYAETRQPSTIFTNVLRRMRRSVLENESQGPIFLGYRLGHLKGNSRIFRAIVYNKGALVLHMLRLLIGDERFFDGLRRLYWDGRFSKVGTDDVERAFQSVTDLPMKRFFDQWVYGSPLPTIKWSWRAGVDPPPEDADSRALALHFEQQAPIPFLLPVTVTITYADGSSEDRLVSLSDARTDVRLQVRGLVRGVEINADGASLGRFVGP